MTRFAIYKGQHEFELSIYWRAVAENGDIVAVGGQAFSRAIDAERVIRARFAQPGDTIVRVPPLRGDDITVDAEGWLDCHPELFAAGLGVLRSPGEVSAILARIREDVMAEIHDPAVGPDDDEDGPE